MQETCSKVPLPLLERKKVRKKRSWPPQKLLTRETSYKVFERRPDTIQTNATLGWPAFENLQRRKPREKVRRAVPRSAYQPAPEAGFLFSLGVMARRLLTAAELFYFVPTFAAEPTGSLKCAYAAAPLAKNSAMRLPGH